MTVYVITGKLGTGKTKGAVFRIREYLREGKRVATNLNLHLEHLMPVHSRCHVMRCPDHPTATQMREIGLGNKFLEWDGEPVRLATGEVVSWPQPKMLKGFDEDHNGALVLDEGGTWLNSRSFNDKGRKEFLDWLWHCRKYGWDLFLICQNVRQIDAQVRESVIEHTVRLHRLDKIKIPGFSAATKLVTAGKFKGTMPKIHVGVVRLGTDPSGLVGDRWVFRGNEINACYETTQVFDANYPHGVYSYLPPWHTKGYSIPEPVPIGIRLLRAVGLVDDPSRRAAVRRVVRPGSRPRAVDFLTKLSPDERIAQWKRLDELGAFQRPAGTDAPRHTLEAQRPSGLPVGRGLTTDQATGSRCGVVAEVPRPHHAEPLPGRTKAPAAQLGFDARDLEILGEGARGSVAAGRR